MPFQTRGLRKSSQRRGVRHLSGVKLQGRVALRKLRSSAPTGQDRSTAPTGRRAEGKEHGAPQRPAAPCPARRPASCALQGSAEPGACPSLYCLRTSQAPADPRRHAQLPARRGEAGQSGTRRDVVVIETTSGVNSAWGQLSVCSWTEGVSQGAVRPHPPIPPPMGGRLWALCPSVCLWLRNRMEALPNLHRLVGTVQAPWPAFGAERQPLWTPRAPRGPGPRLAFAPPPPDPAPGPLPEVRDT